jgi:hypothetical protein
MKELLINLITGALIGIIIGWGFGLGYQIAMRDFLSKTHFNLHVRFDKIINKEDD